MRDSRSFRKKARLLFNLSTSSTSCRERGEVDVHKKREGEKRSIYDKKKRKDMIKKQKHFDVLVTVHWVILTKDKSNGQSLGK